MSGRTPIVALALLAAGFVLQATASSSPGHPADLSRPTSASTAAVGKTTLAPADADGRRTYIVQLSDAPLALYRPCMINYGIARIEQARKDRKSVV